MSPPEHPSVPTIRSRAGALLLAGGLVAALAPATASAKLIPPPGPWPLPVIGAVNPTAGTPYVYNGGNASGNANLRVWVPVRGRRRLAVTRKIGDHTIVRGSLRNRDNGRAISGATVTLATQSVYGGSWYAVGNFRTTRKGLFRAVLPPGYHRRTALLYYPAVNWTQPLYSRRLLVRAKSRVWLASPYRTGRTYRFDGRISGAQVPSTGLLVALQVRNSRGNWVTARLVRTRPSGRFRVRYRFPSRGRLTVRIRMPGQTGWLLYGSYSKTRVIRPR